MLAALAAGEHVGEGDWLVADRQRAGRGRQGREWFDGSGNFMGSTVIRPGPHDPAASSLAFLAGLALYAAVQPLLADPRSLSLKWPNDLMLDDGKLAGILLEAGAGGAVVVGIGVNLAKSPKLPDRRTIALADRGPAPDRDLFAAALASCWDREVERWRQAGLAPILRRWDALAHAAGTALRVHEPGGATIAGSYAGLAEDGALRLRLEEGGERIIHAGDVLLEGKD